MPAVVDPDVCIGCEACIDVCPVQAIEMQGDVAVIDPEKCTQAGPCIDACPVEAISMK